MNSSNYVRLEGNMGDNPEYKVLESGTAVANVSIATSKKYKDAQGQEVTETQWHKLTAFAGNADRLNKLIKGNRILVEGEIKYETYENNEGVTVYLTKIICHSIKKIEKIV